MKTTKLKFKGQEKVKKKSKKRQPVEEKEKEEQGWMVCQTAESINGPSIIIHHLNLLNAVQSTTKVSFKPVPHEDQPPVPLPLEDSVPWVASQVWVIHQVNNKFTFKNCFDKYLSSDKFGVISCEMEAVGPAESWNVIKQKNGFALQNYWGQYLSYNDGTIRCDSEQITDNEVFQIKMQIEKKVHVSAVSLEIEKLEKMHSFGRKELLDLTRNVDGLAKAKKEGRLNEELLNRRALLKPDKFCK
ncbi:hypothetical protein HK103_006811 [Boothiomyces macroporosus]|uniref:Uncharacterized protein n=1 Tax=Boothiomyces macroporosus TaxID=261099 RepID=A0AAD5UD76_9FUNG|nr:hypothetical protein HK103_006811 [Boothiomyces macroporosus]